MAEEKWIKKDNKITIKIETQNLFATSWEFEPENYVAICIEYQLHSLLMTIIFPQTHIQTHTHTPMLSKQLSTVLTALRSALVFRSTGIVYCSNKIYFIETFPAYSLSVYCNFIQFDDVQNSCHVIEFGIIFVRILLYVKKLRRCIYAI